MKKAARFVLMVFLLASILGVNSTLAQSPATMQKIEEVKGEVERIRGLQEKTTIQVRFLNQDQLKELLLEDYDQEYPPEERERDEAILRILGFMGEDVDLDTLMIDLLTEQVAGFYDPHKKYLALISEEEKMDVMDRVNLAHELTHALQDQYFQIDRPPFEDPHSTNSDATFAASCLVEGDATLTMQSYTQTLSVSELEELRRKSGEIETEKFDQAPAYIRDSLLFPYNEGIDFCSYLFRRGGYETIDRAYNDPPSSTEQIMHPEKYLERENPVPVEAPDIASSLPAGWKLQDTDVIGEFDVFELLKTELSRGNAEKGADGWGGCQYRYYGNVESGEGLLLIDLYWDDGGEAREFAPLFRDYATRRFGLEGGAYQQSDGWYMWEGEGVRVALCLRDDRTILVFSNSAEAMGTALSTLGGEGEDLGEVFKAALPVGKEESPKEINWLVAGVVLGLFFLGVILAIGVIVISRKKTPPPPGTPPGYPSSSWPSQTTPPSSPRGSPPSPPPTG